MRSLAVFLLAVSLVYGQNISISSPVVITNGRIARTVYQMVTSGLEISLEMSEQSGQTVADISGNGHTASLGTDTGIASDDPAWDNGALTFDGIDDFLNVVDDAALHPDAWTICAAVKLVPGDKFPIVDWTSTEAAPAVYAAYASFNRPLMILSDETIRYWENDDPVDLQDGNWHFVQIGLPGINRTSVGASVFVIDGKWQREYQSQMPDDQIAKSTFQLFHHSWENLYAGGSVAFFSMHNRFLTGSEFNQVRRYAIQQCAAKGITLPSAFPTYTGPLNHGTAPYIGTTWTNRGPIYDWFISLGDWKTANNPGGYFSASANMLDPVEALQLFADDANSVVADMQSMTVNPVGVIIWDSGGWEGTPYVGNPKNLEYLSPYIMEGLDAAIAIFKAAGYQIGFTLRQGTYEVGTELPATCYDGGGVLTEADKFLDTDGAYGNRTYTCGVAGWYYDPQLVKSPRDSRDVLQNWEDNIAYCKNRWGAQWVTMFYLDTNFTVGTAGSIVPAWVYEKILEDYPGTLIIPEWEIFEEEFYRYVAPLVNCVTDSQIGTPTAIRAINPDAFSVMACRITQVFLDNCDEILSQVQAGDSAANHSVGGLWDQVYGGACPP